MPIFAASGAGARSPASTCPGRWSPGSRPSRGCWDEARDAQSAPISSRSPPQALRAGPMPRTHGDRERHGQRLAQDLARGDAHAARPLGRAAARVHMALLEPASTAIGVAEPRALSRAAFPVGRAGCMRRRSGWSAPPPISSAWSPRARSDARPWLDHGRWGVTHPLGAATAAPAAAARPIAFLPVEGESLHQIPVGPVHAGIIEPGHFRFTAKGETVVRLEERLGYVHKGIDGLMHGATLDARRASSPGAPPATARSPMRWAFARAVEAALGAECRRARALAARPDGRARAARQSPRRHRRDLQRRRLRADARPVRRAARAGAARRRRLLRPPADEGPHRARRRRRAISDRGRRGRAARAARRRSAGASRRSSSSTTTPPRCRTAPSAPACSTPALAARFGAGGYVGRASGRDFDARRDLPYAPYDRLAFDGAGARRTATSTRASGSASDEVEQSLSLIEQILDAVAATARSRADLPAAGRAARGPGAGRGLPRRRAGLGARSTPTGRIARCHLRDPSWFQWPLLEAVIEGNIVADFPLCNKSFNCSYSGHDL